MVFARYVITAIGLNMCSHIQSFRFLDTDSTDEINLMNLANLIMDKEHWATMLLLEDWLSISKH